MSNEEILADATKLRRDRMILDRSQPFALPPLPPTTVLETRAVLKKLIAAREALAALRHLGKQLPNQGVLIQTIGLDEARLSSEIENIVTTNDALHRAFFDDGPIDAATKEVLAYKDALWRGYELVKSGRPLTTTVFEELVGIVKGTRIGVRTMTGTKIANPVTGVVIYTPPSGEVVLRDLLANLERFMHDVDDLDLDPLVRMAVMHYQFEAIHPFIDGNGRTGRILNILFLVEHRLLDLPILYLSRYILEHRGTYYAGLQAVTEHGAWEAWVLFMLDAVEQTARQTSARIESILAVFEETRLLVQTKAPKLYSKDFVELLFRAPYTKISFIEEAGLGNRQTASRWLKALVELGLLQEVRVGRELYFLNTRFWHALGGA